MNQNYVTGTINVAWSIREGDLDIEDVDRELTREDLSAMYDRIAELVTSAFSQRVSIWIDGEDNPPVDVFLEASDMDIEIEEGPTNGMLCDLRAL